MQRSRLPFAICMILIIGAQHFTMTAPSVQATASPDQPLAASPPDGTPTSTAPQPLHDTLSGNTLPRYFGQVQPPAEWIDYQNITWRYSMSYPGTWSQVTSFTNPDSADDVIKERVTLEGPDGVQILVDVWNDAEAQTLAEWVQRYQGFLLELGKADIPSQPNARIAGREAFMITQPGDCMSAQIFYAYLRLEPGVLRVTYTAIDSGRSLPIYEEVLESLADSGSPHSTAEQRSWLPPVASIPLAPAACDGIYLSSCCGETASNARWPCAKDSSTHIDKGNCTWWAAHERPDVGNVVTGDAGQWAVQAQQAGFSVDTQAQVGDIMVIETSPGHVAYVTSVNGSQVTVTEMNWCATCKQVKSYSTSVKKFIHRREGDLGVVVSLRDPKDNQPINTNPLHPQRSLYVQILSSSGQVVYTEQSTVQYQVSGDYYAGRVTLPENWPTGLYIVKVQLDHTLRKQVPGFYTITKGSYLALPSVELIVGDVDGDNRLSILDYNMIYDCYSDLLPARSCTDPNKKRAADINDDGSVNGYDYNLFMRIISVQSGG